MHFVRLGTTALKLQQTEVRKEKKINKGRNKRGKKLEHINNGWKRTSYNKMGK
jgi:hypothetical protein